MKRKMIFSLLIILTIFTITGCGSSKSDEDEYLSRFNDYKSKLDSIDGKVLAASYNKDTLEMNHMDEITGKNISSFAIKDDKDNNKVINFYFVKEDIVISLLEYKDGGFKEVSSLLLPTDYYYLDEFKIYGYGTKKDGIPIFYIETNGSSSILADGFYHDLISVTLENNLLTITTNDDYQGSALYDEEVNAYKEKVNRAGLKMYSLDKSIFEQNNDVKLIFEISRTHNDKEENIDNSNVKYGTTTFINYLKTEGYLILEN